MAIRAVENAVRSLERQNQDTDDRLKECPLACSHQVAESRLKQEEGMKKINLKLNGQWRQFVVSRDRVLLDLLREDLRLTGAKQSCDRKGHCSACTVMVDGKARRSCLTKVVDLEGAEVLTVEGLGTPENPHLIQEAFVLAGAVQCGYCIPGMIMAAKALLDRNLDPTTEDIKRALACNLCR